MAGSIYGSYGIGDVNFDNLMLATDGGRIGYDALTLTEMATTTVPKIAAGSKIEIGGALAKFDSDEAISTTDPVTGATVADGIVYIMLIPSGSNVTAAFTATAPTWSDSKQGYYGTTTFAGNRYAPYNMVKSSTTYSGKTRYDYRHGITIYSATDATSRNIPDGSGVSDAANLSLTFGIKAGRCYSISLSCTLYAQGTQVYICNGGWYPSSGVTNYLRPIICETQVVAGEHLPPGASIEYFGTDLKFILSHTFYAHTTNAAYQHFLRTVRVSGGTADWRDRTMYAYEIPHLILPL